MKTQTFEYTKWIDLKMQPNENGTIGKSINVPGALGPVHIITGQLIAPG